MKIRNELNMRMYTEKTINGKVTSSANDYVSVRLGDMDSVKNQLENGILCFACRRNLSDDIFHNFIYNFILEADELARAAMSVGMSKDEAHAISDIYIEKADQAHDCKDFSEIFSDMCLDFTERINEITADTIASPHIRKCKKYIYQNLGADLSVKGLASLTELDPSYLSKLFSKEVGVPIKKFVTAARIDTAQNLLRYTDLKIIEIAYSLGFSSQSSFIRTFKGETGITPKKYRDKFSV